MLAPALWAQEAPAVAPGAVVDAASLNRVLAPGTWVSIFGNGFTSTTVTATSVPLPTVLDGVSVEVDDGTQTRQAPLLFVSPRQINAQLPYDVPPALAVRVRNAAGVSEADTIAIVDRAPRLFTRPTGEPLVFHTDFTLVSEAAPAEPGETLVAYATGLGAVDPPVAAGDVPGEALSKVTTSVGVTVGDRPADVLYAGLAPANVGLYQVNFTVPPALDDGAFEVAVAAGNERSQRNMNLSVRRKPTGPREFYAAPDGTPGGDGAKQRPWDLKTALRPAPAIKPGDTLWLRGGLYGDGKITFESRLAGTADKPIKVRQAAGERATINGGLAIYAPYTWYWGFEVTNTNPGRTAARNAPECVNTYDGSKGVKLINLVLHDCSQGIGFWAAAENGEAYGNLVYYNGYQDTDRGHGHGIYTQNRDGTKTIADNIVFSQFGLGIQAYGSSNAFVQGYEMQGNIVFNNGAISDGANYVDNIMFAIGIPMERIRVEDNCTYHRPDANKGYSRLGWSFSQAMNKDVVVRKNMWIGGISAIEMWNWTNITFTDNTTYSEKSLNAILSMANGQDSKAYTWDNNTYYGSGTFRLGERNQAFGSWKSLTGLDANSRFLSGRPAGLWRIVRPNKYEPGRANIAIYNWDRGDSVAVDVSSILKSGDRYEIRDAQNFYGAPVAAGVYEGSPVSIPMTGLQPAAPVGSVPTAPVHTAPEFGAFILLKK